MAIKKTKIVLDFDSDSLKELRKILFSNGLRPQQFLKYVVELVSMRDERMNTLMTEAFEYIEENSPTGRRNHHDAESIYKLIEKELSKR